MYEMTKNIFDTALYKKPQDYHHHNDRKITIFEERREDKEALKNDIMMQTKYKYTVPKPVSKSKPHASSREELYSQKLFKGSVEENPNKKTVKETLLLPLINKEM